MKNIRQGVFETNSSSTHSISITEGAAGIYDTIEPDAKGIITLMGGEFGWEWERYNDAITKANYCAVHAIQYGDGSRVSLLQEVIAEHTGAKSVALDFSLDYDHPHWSYIDHQSSDKAGPAFESKQALKDFIFNPSSWLFTGNDNSESPPNFYDVDPNVKYRYRLEIDGADLTESFKSKPTDEQLRDAINRVMQEHPLMKRDGLFSSSDVRWQLCDLCYKTVKGEEFDSFDELSDDIIKLYKVEPQYKNKMNDFIGYKILDVKKIDFAVVKLGRRG